MSHSRTMRMKTPVYWKTASSSIKKGRLSLPFKLYCRAYQRVFQAASYVLPFREPELLKGCNSLNKLPSLIRREHLSNVLIVTDRGVSKLGLMDGLLTGLKKKGIRYTVYDKTVPNPTVMNIEEALKLYHVNSCDSIIAFGGGSSMDCAKGVGARVVRPEKSLLQLKGVLKIRRKLPPVFAVPTTAGTGSEATVATVINDPERLHKYPINDPLLIPRFAVLDPLLTVGLPSHITAATGMDALTHAVEAYIGHSNTRKTKEYSRKAVSLIFENMITAYSDGKNITARTNMQQAAYMAGVAFTRAYIGYVHALAHALGGMYGFAHGLANSVILPYVLEYYGESVYRQLAELADCAGICSKTDSQSHKAALFIHSIKTLNKMMGIPDKLEGINKKDIPLLVDRAFTEANPLYPVPMLLSKQDLARIYKLVMV